VRPLNYDWAEFYGLAEDLTLYAHSRSQMWRRFNANRGLTTKVMNLSRAASSGRAKFQGKVRRLLVNNPEVRRFFDGDSAILPDFYRNRLRLQMGPFWDALPEGAMMHDQNAYLKRHEAERVAAE
jgi:hypothetical protein